MKWNLKLGGEDVTLTILEDVAVRPSAEVLESSPTLEIDLDFKKTTAANLFGSLTADHLSRDHRIFAKAGWWFIRPSASLAFAAEARAVIPGAEEVQQMLVTETNRLLIATNLATVRFREELTEAQIAQGLAEDHLERVYDLKPAPFTLEVRLTQGFSPEIINRLQEKADRYLYAEPSFLQVIKGRVKPNDSFYAEQWHHSNDGSDGGVPGQDIHSERAWEITRGIGKDRPVRIAIIDNGMQISHPDFEGGIFGGGYFKPTSPGTADFIPLTAGVNGFPERDDHGTMCMGMAGARMNNGKGGCGSAPESSLMPFACFDDQAGTQTTLARAISYAADPAFTGNSSAHYDGADVISCSLDTGGLRQLVLRDAIEDATRNGRKGLGIPVFWAVNNDEVKISDDRLCSDPNVIPVGRSTRRGASDHSAFGPELEFLAPGMDIFTTRGDSQYISNEKGTSFATPLAAGVAALVIAVNPNLKGPEVRQILRASCTKHGAQEHNDEYGFGLLNAEDAVKLAMKSLPN
jgi:thermitase